MKRIRRKTKGWLVTIPFVLAVVTSSAQSVRFSQFYDYNLGLGGFLSVIPTNTNGLLAQGTNFKNGVRQSQTVEIDSEGNLLNNYAVFDVNIGYESTSMIRLFNGQIVSAGHLCNYNQQSPSPCDYYFTRLDETGDTLFTKVYERQDTCDLVLDMVQTRPNKIMLIGWTCNDTTQDNTELMFIIVDTLGNEVNRVVWGGGGTDYVHSGTVTNELGEVLMTGSTQSFQGSDNDTWLVKTDSVGNVLWQETYNHLSASGGDGGTEVILLPDGNFALVGGSQNSSTGNSDGFILKVDSDGNEIWTKKYLATIGSQSLWAGVALEDGNILSCGQTTNTNDGSQAGWLIKTDENGDTLWTRTYNPSGLIDRLLNMLVMPNGDIVMVGSGRDTGQTNQDGWILRVDSMGCLVEGCGAVGIEEQLVIGNEQFSIWPNPASESLSFTIQGLKLEKIELSVTDMQGRTILNYYPKTLNFELSVAEWPMGIYLISLSDNDGNRYTKRLVVQD